MRVVNVKCQKMYVPTYYVYEKIILFPQPYASQSRAYSKTDHELLFGEKEIRHTWSGILDS